MPRMLPDGRRLGAHLPLGGGMVKAVERAHEIGAQALQIFADNPTAWRRRAEPPTEAAAFRARLDALDIAPVAIHAPYLVNLAGPEDDVFGRSVAVLSERTARWRPGSAGGTSTSTSARTAGPGWPPGSERLADGLRLVLDEVDDGPETAMVVLENAPGSGFATRDRPSAELADIANAAAARGIAARAPRVLPGHGARLGRRHRRRRPVGDRRLPDRVRGQDRTRTTGHDPLQRLEDGARVAARPARAPGRRSDRRRRTAPPPLPPGPGPRRRTTSRHRGWTRATTRSTSPARPTSRPGAQLADLPPEALDLPAGGSRSGPPSAVEEAAG